MPTATAQLLSSDVLDRRCADLSRRPIINVHRALLCFLGAGFSQGDTAFSIALILEQVRTCHCEVDIVSGKPGRPVAQRPWSERDKAAAKGGASCKA